MINYIFSAIGMLVWFTGALAISVSGWVSLIVSSLQAYGAYASGQGMMTILMTAVSTFGFCFLVMIVLGFLLVFVGTLIVDDEFL